MEDNNLNQNPSYGEPVRDNTTVRPTLGSDSPRRNDKKGFPKWIAAVIGVMLILAVGGFFIVRSLGETAETEPSPSGAGLSTFPTPDSSNQTPSPEPSPETRDVDKSDVRIQVLNGTGTAGEASFLQGELEDLGYTEVEAANADTQGATETTATFAEDLPDEIVDEITEALEDIYTSVETERGDVSGNFDITILTGPRSGAATASPRSTVTASPRATTSPSASPTTSPGN